MGVSLLEEREINQPFTMKMKGLAVLVLAIGITEAQLKFGGGSSSSSSSSGSQDTSTDTRFISSGNELIDGGILGVGAGLLGGAVLSGEEEITAAVTVDTLRTTIPATTIPATTTPATTTPATTTSSRVDASVTTS